MGFQEFNWNYIADELQPVQPTDDYYTNQVTLYMFVGGGLIDAASILIALGLAAFHLLGLCCPRFCLTQTFITILAIEIAVNCCVRLAKFLLLYLVAYPNHTLLFIITDIETVLHFTLFLHFTSSFVVYTFLRTTRYTIKYPSILFGALFAVCFFVSFLNLNFIKALNYIPFYLYFLLFILFTLSNILLLVISIVYWVKDKTSARWMHLRLALFVIISCPPIVFNSVLTFLDLIYIVVGIQTRYPIAYVILTTWRYYSFELTPLFILIAFFLLLPDARKVIDTIVADCETARTRLSTANSEKVVTTETVRQPVVHQVVQRQPVENQHQHIVTVEQPHQQVQQVIYHQPAAHHDVTIMHSHPEHVQQVVYHQQVVQQPDHIQQVIDHDISMIKQPIEHLEQTVYPQPVYHEVKKAPPPEHIQQVVYHQQPVHQPLAHHQQVVYHHPPPAPVYPSVKHNAPMTTITEETTTVTHHHHPAQPPPPQQPQALLAANQPALYLAEGILLPNGGEVFFAQEEG